MNTQNTLQIDITKKSYQGKPVLHNIHIQLQHGKIYGLVGRNGAGKTTLFECIARLIPFEGSVTHSEWVHYKEYTGYLPTDPYFIPRITAEEYIHFCLHARGIKNKKIAEHNMFNLPLQQYATKYSTGMKKKLALSALLLQENQIFILDEPFNGVDLETAIYIKHLLLQLKARGKLILLSSHILSLLTEIADEIFLLGINSTLAQYSQDQFSDVEKDILSFTITR